MNFNWLIIGHNKVVNFLQRSIVNSKLAHAYLFLGPEGVGKTTVANKFAQSLICTNKIKLPCGECQQCKQFNNNIHHDVFKIVKQEDKKNIGIDEIRSMIEKLSLKSFLVGYKIAIIENSDALSEEAANALLKTLEEPSGETVMILLAGNEKQLPETILSRCQIVRFYPLSRESIVEYLKSKQNLSEAEADQLARLSLGLFGQVHRWLENKSVWEHYLADIKNKLTDLERPLHENMLAVKDIFSHRDTFNKRINILQQELGTWLAIFRDMLLIRAGNTNIITNYFLKSQLERLAWRYEVNKLEMVISKIIDLKKDLQLNINPELALENLYISISN